MSAGTRVGPYEIVARFQREGEVLAALMELVEGQELSEVIGTSEAGPSGPAGTPGLKTRPPSRIALFDALAIAKQIADALEAAHEQGIVHLRMEAGPSGPANTPGLKTRPPTHQARRE